MNRGFIKLWRKSKDSTVFAHDGMWKLWSLCLMLANHAEADVTIPGILEPIKVNPGQFITGRDSLHYAYHQGNLKKNYSRKAAPTAITLYRWLLSLSNMQILHIKSYNKYSIITILNWPQYQNNEQQMNNKRTTDEHKQELIKKHKESCAEILNHLNEISGRDFKHTDSNYRLIHTRLNDGHTVDDCKLVVFHKFNDQSFDKKYFRPQTLFQASKFDGYLADARENQKPIIEKVPTNDPV